MESLPRHVAIIMDGNGRWARRRHLPARRGSCCGRGAVRSVVRASIDTGLSYLTLYAFSSENWKRPPHGSDPFDGPVPGVFPEDVDELVERNVRMRIIGSRQRAESDILAMIEDGERRTAHNTGLNLTFAFDYGAQEEIVAAAREMAQAAALGELDPDAITPELSAPDSLPTACRTPTC